MVNASAAWQKPAPFATVTAVTRLTPEKPLAQRGWRLWLNRLAQSFRLMVGVRDYQTYLRHMQQHHPHEKPMNTSEFHRYCLEARFPGKAGAVGKCPC